MSKPFPVRFVGGVPFQVTNMPAAIDWLIDVAVKKRIAVDVRLANSWTVALAGRDESYRELLAMRGVNFPDGAPVAWFMNLGNSTSDKAQRIRGPSLFQDVVKAGVESGVKHFLLGGSPETLDRLRRSLEGRYPGVLIVGQYSPPFAPVSEDYIADCATKVNGSGADVLWVGLGTPKQDIVGAALAPVVGITTLNVGAAFDYAAGTLAEAPLWIQRSGFEWLYRLLAEPRRLWRRYLVGNLEFLLIAVRCYRSDRATASEYRL